MRALVVVVPGRGAPAAKRSPFRTDSVSEAFAASVRFGLLWHPKTHTGVRCRTLRSGTEAGRLKLVLTLDPKTAKKLKIGRQIGPLTRSVSGPGTLTDAAGQAAIANARTTPHR